MSRCLCLQYQREYSYCLRPCVLQVICLCVRPEYVHLGPKLMSALFVLLVIMCLLENRQVISFCFVSFLRLVWSNNFCLGLYNFACLFKAQLSTRISDISAVTWVFLVCPSQWGHTSNGWVHGGMPLLTNKWMHVCSLSHWNVCLTGPAIRQEARSPCQV